MQHKTLIIQLKYKQNLLHIQPLGFARGICSKLSPIQFCFFHPFVRRFRSYSGRLCNHVILTLTSWVGSYNLNHNWCPTCAPSQSDTATGSKTVAIKVSGASNSTCSPATWHKAGISCQDAASLAPAFNSKGEQATAERLYPQQSGEDQKRAQKIHTHTHSHTVPGPGIHIQWNRTLCKCRACAIVSSAGRGHHHCLNTCWEMVHDLVAVLGGKRCMKNMDLAISVFDAFFPQLRYIFLKETKGTHAKLDFSTRNRKQMNVGSTRWFLLSSKSG